MTGQSSRWRLPRPARPRSTAVIYLVRGADLDWQADCARFRRSYASCPAGHPHDLILVTKGFADEADLRGVERDFADLASRAIRVEDATFDLGAYRDAARLLEHERVCCLNTGSCLAGADWLLKLVLNLDREAVGLVGATGSFESLSRESPDFPPFPNPHLRSNAFLIDRALFLSMIGDAALATKMDAYRFESGRDGLTRRVLGMGLGVLVVGRDARGRSPPFWPQSETFRIGDQSNLLVEDRQTRLFASHDPRTKRAALRNTWGPYLTMPAGGDIVV